MTVNAVSGVHHDDWIVNGANTPRIREGYTDITKEGEDTTGGSFQKPCLKE